MSSLLPSLQAADLREALTSYLATTFALTDDDVRRGLQAFLTDPEQGIFRGPYVRLRLPFRPASGAWSVPLDWHPPGFTPYGHQAAAFERLSSKHHTPLPTLVTTGTGSGKTESFLIPILDHVLRARRAGQTGIKALILYPMNALANDQALDQLLLRLGLALGVARPGRPLGDVTPVATSATLGTGDPKAMLEFAATVFGVTLDESAIVMEERISVDEWFAERARTDQPSSRNQPAERWQLSEVAAAVRAARTPRDACAAVVRDLVVDQPRHGLHVNELTDREAHQLLDEIAGGGDLVGLIAQAAAVPRGERPGRSAP